MLGLHVDHIQGQEAHCTCPYHHDTTPSASFNMVKGVFYCFSCGASANAEQLARDLSGVIVKRDSLVMGDEEDDPEEWMWIQHQPLALGNSYLVKRGVSDNTVRQFDIRQHPDGIAFLLYDQQHKLRGVQIRHKEKRPKYLIYGRPPTLWPAWIQYDYSEPVFIVEGVFGVLRAYESGIQAYAVLGAMKAAKAWEQAALSYRELYAFMDDDEAGNKAALELLLASRGRVRAILPGGEADELSERSWQRLLQTHDVVSSPAAFHNILPNESIKRTIYKFR